ncbi:MAG: hypothetical protein NTV41_02690 [Actinobacteria bacterium]|nr:hypothetical protein [Actinomycetota bacterium]
MNLIRRVIVIINTALSSDTSYAESEPQLTALRARQIEDFRYLHLLDKYRH